MQEVALATPRKWTMPRWIDKVFLLVGLALLVWVVSRYPMAELGRAFKRLGPWAMTTPLIAMLWMCCNTSALHLLLDRQISWLRLLKIRLIGDGYNALLPLAGMGGEPYRIKHISEFVPVDQTLTALIRDRVIENAVGLLFTGTWIAVALGRWAFAASMRAGMVAYVTFAAAVGIISVMLMVTSLPGRASAALARMFGVKSQAAVKLPPSRFIAVLAWYIGARIAGCLEITLLLWLLGLGFDPITNLFCYSLLQAAGFIGFAIPAGIGVFEGTAVYLFEVLKFPGPLGVAFAFARRGRMLVVGLFGVVLHLASLPRRAQ
jgi:lysylphosphatidylglycerol synthase-like protein